MNELSVLQLVNRSLAKTCHEGIMNFGGNDAELATQ
jgi:hypothetical protein